MSNVYNLKSLKVWQINSFKYQLVDEILSPCK